MASEPFSMIDVGSSSEDCASPGADRRHAGVGDCGSDDQPAMPRRTPRSSRRRDGFSRSTKACARLRLLDGDGKVIRAQAPYHKPVKAGTWNHLTFTYDGSKTENGYAFYMNGTQDADRARTPTAAQDSTIAPELKESVSNTLR